MQRKSDQYKKERLLKYSWNFTILSIAFLFTPECLTLVVVVLCFMYISIISLLFSVYCLWPYLSLYVRRFRNACKLACDNLEPIGKYKRDKRCGYKWLMVGIFILYRNVNITQKKNRRIMIRILKLQWVIHSNKNTFKV